MSAKKLRVLSPAKADQCSAARRTSPKTHEPSNQIAQNTACITAFIANEMSVADSWASIVRDLWRYRRQLHTTVKHPCCHSRSRA